MNIQTIPYNQEAEQAVLGALMLEQNHNRTAQVFAILEPTHFYFVAHQKIFEVILDLAKKNRSFDLMAVNATLKARGMLESVGGFAYLAEISRNIITSSAITYAKLVNEGAVKRFYLAKLQDCQAVILSAGNMSLEDKKDIVGRLVTEMSDFGKTGASKGLRTGREVGGLWLADYETRLSSPESTRGLTTGLQGLDDLLGAQGLVKQALVVVGARPKCGKTAFYTMMAENCVVREKKPALLFSLEMSNKMIFERLVAQRGKINAKAFYESDPDVIYHKFHTTQESLLHRTTNAIGELINDDLLFIDDTPNVSINHIRNECRRIKRERGEIGLIGVDYLTLMKAEDAERNDLAYGKLTKDLKTLAREMDCVVLLLTQLNRKLEDRKDKRPMPSDSRDTGQIEQECDYWIGLYRESAYDDTADPRLTEVILRLNRYGETGTVYADQRFGVFFNCDQQEARGRTAAAKFAEQQKTEKQPKRKF